MKALQTFVSAAAVALSLAASAAPAQAAVFAQFTPNTAASDYKWINNGPSDTGTGGHFFSITSNSQTTAHAVATHFSFLDPVLSALAFLPATFIVDATAPSGNPATLNGGGIWNQTHLNGSFSFTYTGVTINNYLGSGINLIHNSNLLSGVFTNAWIQGAGGSGAFNLTSSNGGTASYASAYETFANLAPNTEDFSFNLLSATPTFGAQSSAAMKSFRANGGGNFSYDAFAVPEPETWGLMIVGFAGVGLMMRGRRRRQAVATA